MINISILYASFHQSTGGRTESSLGQQHQQQQQQQAHPLQQLTGDTTGTSTDDDDNREGIGVPLISVKGCEPKENVTMNITSSGLPSLDEVRHRPILIAYFHSYTNRFLKDLDWDLMVHLFQNQSHSKSILIP